MHHPPQTKPILEQDRRSVAPYFGIAANAQRVQGTTAELIKDQIKVGLKVIQDQSNVVGGYCDQISVVDILLIDRPGGNAVATDLFVGFGERGGQ